MKEDKGKKKLSIFWEWLRNSYTLYSNLSVENVNLQISWKLKFSKNVSYIFELSRSLDEVCWNVEVWALQKNVISTKSI